MRAERLGISCSHPRKGAGIFATSTSFATSEGTRTGLAASGQRKHRRTPVPRSPAPSEQPSIEFAARAKATWAQLIRKVYVADLLNAPSARGRCASSRVNRGSGSHPTHPRAPGPVGAEGDATKSATGSRGLAGARRPAAHLPPGS